MLGRVPMPEVSAGMYLIDILFKVGPIRGEMPLVEGDLEPWERRRGIELSPWQAELILDMSQAYLQHMHSGRELSSISPWHPSRQIWMDVTSAKAQQEIDARKELAKTIKKEKPNGSHKRRRN